MFIKEDLYTTIGSQKLYHCWTDKVTKFDSSSFYNWEQDNMPVYDLDERTHYLWEKLGFPTSSIPGVALVVSADAPNSAVDCNKNIFKTVSAAIDALPNVINFPVVIEVASFGNLGDLILDNYKFGPRGSIEIINRNFANGYADGYLQIPSAGYVPILMSRSYIEGGTNPYYHASAFHTNYGVFRSPGSGGLYDGLVGTYSARTHFALASALSISSLIFSGSDLAAGNISDSRLAGNLNGFVSRSKSLNNNSFTDVSPVTLAQYNSRYSKSDLIIASRNTTHPLSGDPAGIGYHDTLYYKSYDLNPEAYEQLGVYDASTFDDSNQGQHLYFAEESLGNTGVNGLFYGNRLTKVVVNNCDGPIYIRNFFLDGSGANLKNNHYGVEINNCKNIFIENLVSTRYRKAGFIFNNSNVVLLRGCVATRNYDFDNSNNRIAGPWNSVRAFDILNTASGVPYLDYGAGLVANNTNITISSTRTFEEPIVSSYSYNRTYNNTGGTVAYGFSSAYNKNYIFEFSKNANGVILNNSQLINTTDLFNQNQTDHYAWTMNLDIFDNVQEGMALINSKLSFNGRVHFVGNRLGLQLDSSVFEIDKASFVYNQRVGLRSNNSKITYGKNLLKYVNDGGNAETNTPVYFDKNGKHMVLQNSQMLPVFTSGMDKVYDLMTFKNPLGNTSFSEDGESDVSPGVEISNGSKAILMCPYDYRDQNHPYVQAYNPCKGAAFNISKNSTCKFIGTQHGATRIAGPVGGARHATLAGVYAGENSTIEFNGPTVIANYGVDVLGENNSTIKFKPPSLDDSVVGFAGEDPEIECFNLSNVANHTSVELHSTRACIVVDSQSKLEMKDLGNFPNSWDATGSNYSNRVSDDFIYNPTSRDLYTSAGGMQFYPNANILTETDNEYDPVNYPGQSSATLSGKAFTYSNNRLWYLINPTTAANDYSSTTTGGMCVRALNNSIVDVMNVNFPCGWWNASAPYYDNTVAPGNGGLCYRLFIWNIADSSQLNAKLLSVNSLYPSAAAYVGPFGVWVSSNTVLSGLPMTTPDTSSTSVLDYYGVANTSSNPFAVSSAKNYGPFRLYFGVNPVVYSLSSIQDSNNLYTQFIPQIYSQGYQPSGNMVCITSSIHGFALKKVSTSVAASGYYYGNEVMDGDGFIRAYLDESAADTFANAKHCAVGKSNNARLVSIYYPYYGATYGAHFNPVGVNSINFFNLETRS